MKSGKRQNYTVKYATGKSILSYKPAQLGIEDSTLTLTADNQEIFSVKTNDVTQASLFIRFNEVRSAKMTIKIGNKVYNFGFEKSSQPKELLAALKSIGIKTIYFGRYANVFAIIVVLVTFLWIFVIQK